MLASGALLADRYLLRRQIAVGGMGEVWEAEDTRLDRRVAVKVLKPELCGDAEFLHRFRTEARTTASLNHPCIAAVHDYGETAASGGAHDTAYLVMELVDGEPLSAILARERRISPERTLDVLEQAAQALHAAHERGLVHRDVKPGNILVTPSGAVKLTDFGIAKAAHAAPVTRSGMVMGTAHYVAPEQASGQEAEPASDVYSLAVVGYECLAGVRPFLSDNSVTVAVMHIRDVPPPLPPDVPTGVRALISAGLVKDPRRRYRNGREFAAAVAAVRAGAPLPPPSGLRPPAATATSQGLPVNLPPGRLRPGVPPQRQPGGAHVTAPALPPVAPPPSLPGPALSSAGLSSAGLSSAGLSSRALPIVTPAPRRQRRAVLWVLVVVLVVLLLGLAVWVVRVAVRAVGSPEPGWGLAPAAHDVSRSATTGGGWRSADRGPATGIVLFGPRVAVLANHLDRRAEPVRYEGERQA